MTSPFTKAMTAIGREHGADPRLVPVDAGPLADQIAKEAERVQSVHGLLLCWEQAVRGGVIRQAHARRAQRIAARMALTAIHLTESAEELYRLTQGGNASERPRLWWFTQLFQRTR